MTYEGAKPQDVEKIIDILWDEPLDLYGIQEEIAVTSEGYSLKENETISAVKQILVQLIESGWLDFRNGLYLLTRAGRELSGGSNRFRKVRAV